ncbi:DUF1302 family protein [Azotobacter armeniacus]
MPGSQFKEILLPTEQISGNWQPPDTVSVSAKYSNEIFPDFLLFRTRPTPVFQRLARTMQGTHIGLNSSST